MTDPQPACAERAEPTDARPETPPRLPRPRQTGTLFFGRGFGATGKSPQELRVQQRRLTGLSEIRPTPPTRARSSPITFPLYGNVGVNSSDARPGDAHAAGMVVCAWLIPTDLRLTGAVARAHLAAWLLAAVDARHRRLLDHAAAHSPRDSSNRAPRMFALAHDPEGQCSITSDPRQRAPRRFPASARPVDLARESHLCANPTVGRTRWPGPAATAGARAAGPKVVAIDYWGQAQHPRCSHSGGLRLTVLPATATAETCSPKGPTGLFSLYGPGDPAATGEYAVPV